MRTLFLLNLFAALAVCNATAGAAEGMSASLFESTWNGAGNGSTVSLPDDTVVTLSGCSLSPQTGVTLAGTGEATLIAAPQLDLKNCTIRNIHFANSAEDTETLLSLSGITVLSGVAVSDTRTEAAAVQLVAGATLNVNSGAIFENNVSGGNAGAIDAGEGSKVNLSAEAGKDIIFSGNYAANSTPADVYLAQNATMKLTTAANSRISFGAGIASAAGATIEKTGKGAVELGDGSYYAGKVKVTEGTAVLGESTGWSGSQFEVAKTGALELAEGAQLSAGSISLQGNLTVAGDSTLGSITGDSKIAIGGSLTFAEDACLSTLGSVNYASGITLNVSGYGIAAGLGKASYCLIDDVRSFGSLVPTFLNWKVNGQDECRYRVASRGGDIYLVVQQDGKNLTWLGEKKAVWSTASQTQWNEAGKQSRYTDGDYVSFTAGNITMEGKVAPGGITANVDKSMAFKSNKKKPGSLTGGGDLTKLGKGTLTLNDGNGSWSGDTYLMAGTIKVSGTTALGKGYVYVQGGTLNLASKAVDNDIAQAGNAAIKSGKKYTGTYTLESGELQKGSSLNVAGSAMLAGGTMNGALSGAGKVLVTGNVKLGDAGKITTPTLVLEENSALTVGAKGLSSTKTNISMGDDAVLTLGGKLSANSLTLNGGSFKTTATKPAAVTLKGNAILKDEASLGLNGKLSAMGLQMTDSSLILSNAKPQSVTVKGSASLTNSTATITGKLTAANLALNKSSMMLSGAKPQNLTVKQSLTLGSGSSLSLNGKLSAGSLTLNDGSKLTLNGSKPQTLKVKGTLTLNSGSSIILDYDFVQGKTYKLLTFKSYSGTKDFCSIFGVDEADCVFSNTGKAITMTLKGSWNPKTPSAVSDAAPAPVASAVVEANPVADALVQANWGQLEASRAFVNAIANRSMAVQLGSGERAVWASAIGGSSRHSSAGGHAGADTNISGGAFGLETQVGRASVFGLALGNSWTRVSAHGFDTIKQDTTHLGIYGQTNWRKVSADWSAAYGRSESDVMGSDWNQKHLQLDGRVSYNHELSECTVLSTFGGMQYYASDSANVDGIDTGSLQNLRAEIGVGASYRMGKLSLYGEAAVHQDIVRHNPKVSMEGLRFGGMNPGRTGLNFTVGVSYELSEQWSVNASYTGEVVENANAHSANIGTTYKF